MNVMLPLGEPDPSSMSTPSAREAAQRSRRWWCGNFARADVLVEGKKILAVGPNLGAGGPIDASGAAVPCGWGS
jgi:hypothetical protein